MQVFSNIIILCDVSYGDIHLRLSGSWMSALTQFCSPVGELEAHRRDLSTSTRKTLPSLRKQHILKEIATQLNSGGCHV